MDLPKLDHLTKAVRLQRKDDDLPVNLINRADIPNMPIEYQQALNAEQFLSFDISMGDIDKTLIFAANNVVQLLSVLEEWFGDGTFKISRYVRRYFFSHILYMLDLINELHLVLMFYFPNINQNAYNRFYQEIFN